MIAEEDQVTLLCQGLAFSLAFSVVVRELHPPVTVRCIVSAGATNATFRFHRVRSGERHNDPDLDRYRLEKMLVVDIQPGR